MDNIYIKIPVLNSTKNKGVTVGQSRIYLIASIIIFISAEIVAGIIQLWMVNSPSLSKLATYNRTLSSLPMAMSTGASIFLVLGLPYYSRRRVGSIIAFGIVLMAISYILTYMNVLSSTFEYYPGLYWTIQFGPISNLVFVGWGTTIAGIMSIALRDMIVRKTGVGA